MVEAGQSGEWSLLAEAAPEGRCKLPASIRGDVGRHAISGDPRRDECFYTRGSLHVAQGYGFQPSGRPVDDGE